MRFLFPSLAFLALATAASSSEAVGIFLPDGNPRADFAAADILRALEARGRAPALHPLTALGQRDPAERIILAEANAPEVRAAVAQGVIRPPGDLRAEGFSLRVATGSAGRGVWVIGHEDAGVMYGGLEVAEIARLHGLGAVREADQNPHMPLRGVKFNLPLDVRTPSYSDASDAAQHNIATVWDFDFWAEFIDRLARQRHNFISLWNLHPFPSLVRVPEYPDIALGDVQRSTNRWNEMYSLQATNLDLPEIVGQVETLRRMTIDDKIMFWRRVMRHGRDRNVAFAVVTWNIFTNGTGGKYGITDHFENPATIDYFRKSVRELLLTYPDLLGVGLTTGENFRGASFQEKEDWAFATYGRGVLDAAAAQPGRKFMLIHRQHQAGARDIAKTFAPVVAHPDIEFVFSFKYAEAHAMSSTRQPFADAFLRDIGDARTMWTLRNDDNYLFRWGGAGFVREFIRNIPHALSRGFYYGSDQWIWGREFLGTEPESPRPLEVAKHWFHWLLWGRRGDDPSLPDERLVAILQERFPAAPAEALFEAWQAASMTYPLTTGFHWGALDFQWYIEACQSRPGPARTPGGFHDINRFISLRPHPGTDNIAIPDFVEAVLAGRQPEGTTPLQVAEKLHAYADRALALAATIRPGGDRELRRTLDDIRCMATLGKYYGHKIRAATELEFLRRTLERPHQEAVAAELNQAALQWRTYAALLLANYEADPLWTNRVGYVDFRKAFDDVLYDLTITGSTLAVPAMQPTPGGAVVEAEDATTNGVAVRSDAPGYTGRGYLDFGGSEGRRYVEWTYDAARAGTHILEFRYAMRWEAKPISHLTVNGATTAGVVVWSSPDGSTWVWDRKRVELRQGRNTIRLTPGGVAIVDHLNVIPADG